ncbi:SNRK (predicted) [Pycnogonum litorale]
MSRFHLNAYDGKIAGLYDLEDTLGRGHFAVVKLARHVFTGEKVAVKVIDKNKLDEVSRDHLFQEVRCMKLVQHPNVVRLYEVIDTQTKLYLILELGDGGDLYDYIMKHEKGLNEEMARKYFQQIVHAISYCHKLHVVHRDLKPENVVFFEKLGMVKLTDFGFSNRFCPGQKLETSCGSLAYSAPEILLGDSYDAPAVDVWSLGVILFMLVCGQAPFQEVNDSETLTMILDCKYTIPCYVSEGCRSLINQMLIRAPEKRATLEDIANNEWLRETDDLQPADYLPLVSREHLQEDDHAYIVQKMVNGNIASKEAILEALDKDSYDHITATYFLLAERKLRAQRHLKAQSLIGSQSQNKIGESASNESRKLLMASQAFGNSLLQTSPLVTRVRSSDDNQLILPNLSPSLLAPPIVYESPNTLLPWGSPRKCSIVCEEEDEDSTSQASSRRESLRSCVSTPDISSPTKKQATTEIDNENKSSSASSSATSSPLSPKNNFNVNHISASKLPSVQFQPVAPSAKNKTLPTHNRRLHAVKSSPQLVLNEICEEGESDIEPAMFGKPSNKSRANLPSPEMLRRFEHRLTTGRVKAKTRTTSCSSSEASDDDAENRKRSKHSRAVHNVKPLPPRRDHSHDDSSDSQDQGAGFNSARNRTRGRSVARDQVSTGKTSNDKSDSNKRSDTNGGNRKQNGVVPSVVLNSTSRTLSHCGASGDSIFDSTDSIPIPEVRRLSYQDDENILPQVYIRNSKDYKNKLNKSASSFNGSVSIDNNLCGSTGNANYGMNLLRGGLKLARKTCSTNSINIRASFGKSNKFGSISSSRLAKGDGESVKALPGMPTVDEPNLDINQNGLKKPTVFKKRRSGKHRSLVVDPSSKCCNLS